MVKKTLKKTGKKIGGSNNSKLLIKIVKENRVIYVSDVDDSYINECNKFLEVLPKNPYFLRRRNFLLYKRKLDSYFKTYYNYLILLYDKKEVFDKLKLLFYLVMFQRHMKIFYDKWYYSVVKVYEYFLKLKIVDIPEFVSIVSVKTININNLIDLLNKDSSKNISSFTRLNPKSNIFIINYNNKHQKQNFEEFLKKLGYIKIIEDSESKQYKDRVFIPEKQESKYFVNNDKDRVSKPQQQESNNKVLYDIDGVSIPEKQESKNTVVDYILKKKQKGEDKIDSMKKDFIDYFIKSKNIKLQDTTKKELKINSESSNESIKESSNNTSNQISLKEELHNDIIYSLKEGKKLVMENLNKSKTKSKEGFNNSVDFNINRKIKNVISRNAESYFDDVELFIKSKLPKNLKKELQKNMSMFKSKSKFKSK